MMFQRSQQEDSKQSTPGTILHTAAFDSESLSSQHNDFKPPSSNQQTSQAYQSPFFQQNYHQQASNDSQEIEQMFHKAYFDQLLKMNQQSPLFDQGSHDSIGAGNQDFASNEEEFSSIAIIPSNSPPKVQNTRKSNGNDIDKQISKIMEVIGKLNKMSIDDNFESNGQQGVNPSDIEYNQTNNRASLKSMNKKQSQRSLQNFNKDEKKSPLRKFLTTNKTVSILKSSVSSQDIHKFQNPAQALKQVLQKKQAPVIYKQKHSPNLDQSPRFNKTQSTQQKIDSAIQAFSALTVSASGGKLTKSPVRSHSKVSITRKQYSPKKSRSNSKKRVKDEYLNQDLISRLFINQQKQQEVKDQKRYIQLQREVEEVKDRPSITPRSRDIALSSERFHLPMFSPLRYQIELDTYLSKKEEAKRLKLLQDRQKEVEEEKIMSKSSSLQKLDMSDFLRKYNNQVHLWETRIKCGTSKVHKYPHEVKSDDPTFKPLINQKSKVLAKDMVKIEKRALKLQEEKKKKIEERICMEKPSFQPQINPISEMIASESRRSMMEATRKSPNSPMLLTQYIMSMKRLIDHESKESCFSSQDFLIQTKRGRSSSSNNRKSLNERQSNPLSKSSKSTSNLHSQKQFKNYSPVSLSRPRLQQEAIISNLQSQDWNNLLQSQQTINIQGPQHISIEKNHDIQQAVTLLNQHEQNQIEFPPNDEVVIETLSSQNNSQTQNDQEQHAYLSGMQLSNQNLQSYLQNYMNSVGGTSENDQPTISAAVGSQYQGNIDIFQQYLKLRKEFDDQISSRAQLLNVNEENQEINKQQEMLGSQAIWSDNNGIRESQITKTVTVENQYSFVKDSAYDIDQTGSNFQSSSNNYKSNQEGYQFDQQYAINFAGTLGPLEAQPHNFNSQELCSPTTFNHQPYTAASSCETTEAAEHKNRQLTTHLTASSKLPVKSLLSLDSNTQQLQQNTTTFPPSQASKEIAEVEQMLAQIRDSIDILDTSKRQSLFHPFKVDEMEKESSSSSTSSEEVQQQRKSGCDINQQWSNALNSSPSDRLKKNQDYMNIVHTTKQRQQHQRKTNKTESIKGEKIIANGPGGASTKAHRKSPTHAQINRVPLETHRNRLLALQSIGSSCSNPSSGSVKENLIVEETKQENSQANTYQSGVLKPSVEDYSLNTWNSPTKAGTAAAPSQNINYQQNNLKQYDSAFRAYLLQQLSEQKMSEIALYVDPETRQMIENSRITLLQSVEKEPLLNSACGDPSSLKNDYKQEEIVRRLILSNQKQFQPFSRYNEQGSLLSIPKDVYQEIEEYGLDTLTIIKSVIAQFPDILDQSKQSSKQSGATKTKLRQQMKSAEQHPKYQASMFVTFNKSKPYQQ